MNKEIKLDGICHQLNALNEPLNEIFEIRFELEIDCLFYFEQETGKAHPPSLQRLQNLVNRLHNAYMQIAALTGLDPCEQFNRTKEKK